jgi:hypothetical protein
MDDSTNQVKHNVYFDGQVQSLGLKTEKGPATLGVMKKGTYQFTPTTPETIIVISGVMNIKVGDGSSAKYQAQEHVDLPPNIPFEVVCDADAAYICYYE